jgi:hypothetical protein
MTQKIDVSAYEKVHGKLRSRREIWGFRAKNQDGFSETYFCPFSMDYADAISRAKKYFCTATVIHVLP